MKIPLHSIFIFHKFHLRPFFRSDHDIKGSGNLRQKNRRFCFFGAVNFLIIDTVCIKLQKLTIKFFNKYDRKRNYNSSKRS